MICRCDGCTLRLAAPQGWPCRCYPVVHLDLRRDIPADRRRAVRMGLTSWLFAALGYFVNWLVSAPAQRGPSVLRG